MDHDAEIPIRDAYAHVTMALATATDEQAAAVRTILRGGAGLLGLPEGATLSAPQGLVLDRRELWCTLVDSIRVATAGASGEPGESDCFRLVQAGDWETVLASMLIRRDWTTIERTARELDEEAGLAPRTGEDAPLSDEQVGTLTDLIRAGDRAQYDALCGAFGTPRCSQFQRRFGVAAARSRFSPQSLTALS